MSERIVAAVVCEGKTDYPILRGMIEKLWPEVDEVLCLQPELDETERASNAAGWSEVRRWCTDHAGALDEVLVPDIGPMISLLLIAIDLDIAVEAGIADPPTAVGSYESKRLRAVMRAWCRTPSKKNIPREVLFSTPVVAIETWIVAALFPRRNGLEKIQRPADELMVRKKLRKSPRDNKPWKEIHRYQEFVKNVSASLSRVRKRCAEADRTCREIEQLRSEQTQGEGSS